MGLLASLEDIMAKDGSTKDRKGQQPEAEASFMAAGRAGSKKPDDQGLTAKEDTAPKNDSLEKEQARAADILKKGAQRDTGRDPGRK